MDKKKSGFLDKLKGAVERLAQNAVNMENSAAQTTQNTHNIENQKFSIPDIIMMTQKLTHRNSNKPLQNIYYQKTSLSEYAKREGSSIFDDLDDYFDLPGLDEHKKDPDSLLKMLDEHIASLSKEGGLLNLNHEELEHSSKTFESEGKVLDNIEPANAVVNPTPINQDKISKLGKLVKKHAEPLKDYDISLESSDSINKPIAADPEHMKKKLEEKKKVDKE